MKRKKRISDDCYNTIDYKDALQHIKNIIDLEWNGMITITEYKERIEDVVLIALDNETEKESKWKMMQITALQ